jgi:hypothetical protein
MSNESAEAKGINFFLSILLNLTVLAAFLVPYHYFITNPLFSFNLEVSRVEDISKAVLGYYQSTARMNLIEIGLWVLLPSLLCFVITINTKARKWLKLSAGAILVITIFGLAWWHNQLSVNQYYKQAQKTYIPKGETLLRDVEYPSVEKYTYRESRWLSYRSRSITFETSAPVDQVYDYYINKGFKGGDYKEGKSLSRKFEFRNDLGSDTSISLSIMPVGNKVEVTAVVDDYQYT